MVWPAPARSTTRRARPAGGAAGALALLAGSVLVGACGAGGYIYSPQVGGGGSASTTPSTQSAPGSAASSGTTSSGSSSSGSSGSSSGGTTTSPTTTSPPATGGTPTSTCTTTPDTFANFAQAALTSNCNGCHAGEWDTTSEASAKASSMRGQIASGAMPTSGVIDATVKKRLLAWLACPTPLP